MPTKHTRPSCHHGEIQIGTYGNVYCPQCRQWGAPGDKQDERERNIRILRGVSALRPEARSAINQAIREIEHA